MSKRAPTTQEQRRIDKLVDAYESQKDRVELFRGQLFSALAESKELAPHIHSLKSRLKDSAHLRDKLCRKLVEAKSKGKPLDVTTKNLLTTINDLAGVRILHLYTRQIKDIDRLLRAIVDEQQYSLREPPFARTWDDESRAFFESCGIETQKSDTLYTSVHYVVGSASRTVVTCEIQVRTLMEEVWGEVDHSINYPNPAEALACREQLKVLARVTSSATRLVDSIFLTLEDYERQKATNANESPARAAKKKLKRRPTKR